MINVASKKALSQSSLICYFSISFTYSVICLPKTDSLVFDGIGGVRMKSSEVPVFKSIISITRIYSFSKNLARITWKSRKKPLFFHFRECVFA